MGRAPAPRRRRGSGAVREDSPVSRTAHRAGGGAARGPPAARGCGRGAERAARAERRQPPAHTDRRRVAPPVRPGPSAGRPGGDRPLGRRHAGGGADRGAPLRRRDLLALLYRRFADRQPALVRPGGLRPACPRRAAAGPPRVTDPTTAPAPDPVLAFERTSAALGTRYRLERIAASNADRVLFEAFDETLKRRVSIRINFYRDDRSRTWFLRSAEALGQLDHPAIRQVYDAGVVGDLAYRIGNWIDGEPLEEAVRRGPRNIPAVLSLARDLLGALDHAHLQRIIVRRIVPATVLVGASGRGIITDLRFSSYTLPAVPPGTVPDMPMFMAPDIRDGAVGDPAADVYTAGALLYFAVTGQPPPLDPRQVRPPTELRPTCPRAIEPIILRALRPTPEDRYLTAAEMLEDLASDAGTFETRAAAVIPGSLTWAEDRARWEAWLRRALGDDYELLALLGKGGFGRVYRVRDLHLEREVALKVLHPTLTQDPEVVERFRREAQLAARLNHPNIVNIYDIAGRFGLLWYTMELIDGPSLAQLVEREGPLPLDQVLRLLREALSALAHAHGFGLVHRDIKPENMLIDPDGSLR